jgi:hydrogenase maturation protease
MTKTNPRRIVVLGVGNLLMSDDGLGVHAVRHLLKDPPEGIEIYDAGTAALTALDLADGADRLLMIDAIQAKQPPGTLMSFNGFTAQAAPGMPSLHAMGLATAMQLLPEERRPDSFTVIGAEPESLAYGMNLSDTLRKTLPELLRQTKQVLNQWICEGCLG